MDEEGKPFWASKTIWVNIVAFVATMSAAFGVDLGLDLTVEGQTALVGSILTVTNIILRITTKEPLTR